jgi:prepilin-type N-terminal cleavage/methylation domain-containing protein
MKKAFTLLELLVVIVIIAIMMAITMRFSGDFVYDIEFKKIKDSIVGDYHAVL